MVPYYFKYREFTCEDGYNFKNISFLYETPGNNMYAVRIMLFPNTVMFNT